MPSLSVAEIAALLGAAMEGDATHRITGANALSDAGPADLAFVSGKLSLAQSQSAASQSKAGCLIIPLTMELPGSRTLVRASEPRAAFARTLEILYPAKQFAHGIHSTAIVAESAVIAPDSHVGAHVSIGQATVVESGCVVSAGCFIGDYVLIRKNSFLHPNISVSDRVRIGARVIIQSNAVIGADGFGFSLIDGHYRKFPQVGTVEIEDDVEIGAGCCIDRAALGATRIGRGTKLDNLVHVAHNCILGEDVVVAAQTGFSGSVMVGDHAIIGGQTGVGEKARIEAHAVVGGKAGILTSATVHAGEPVWGIPARPLRKHLKGLANINKLPELKEQVRQLGQRLVNLEKRLLDWEKNKT